MDSLVPTPAASATTSIPAQWIASGVITPVIASPAATTVTAWVPQPVTAMPSQVSPNSLLDAIASVMLGAAAPQQLAAQAGHAAAVPVPAVMSAPVTMAQSVVHTMPEAPTTPAASPPTAAAVPATSPGDDRRTDPTATASVPGALSGFGRATGRVISTVTDAAGAGASRARRVGNELWAGVRSPRAIHVSQVPSKYNASPAPGNRDCGPASVVMTLKLLGAKVPGAAASASPQRLINRVRQLAGNAANTVSTTNHELGRALRAAGTKTREITDAVSIRSAVLSGKPVILNGNPRNSGAYGPKFSSSQMTPYDGAHWIVVSGFDDKAGKFIINDPLSKVGPVKVSPAQLEAYRGGSMGIEVEAA